MLGGGGGLDTLSFHIPYPLFSPFNFANLELKYFAGPKFCTFLQIAVFKVIKFRESSNWCSFSRLPFQCFVLIT